MHDRLEEITDVLFTRRPVQVLLALVALAASALFVAACGSGGGSKKTDVASVLKDTFGSGKPVKSGKLDVTVSLDAKGLPSLSGPVTLKLNGPFQSNGKDELPSFGFDLSLNAAGQSFTAGAVSTGKKGFLTFQGQAYAVGDPLYQSFKNGYKQAQKQSGQKSGPTFKTLGIDPLGWLADPKNAGTEDVGGTSTTHIAASIDVPKFLVDVNTLLQKAGQIGVPGAAQAQVPTSLTEKQRTEIADAVSSATIDVYTGKDDRILRRLVVEVDFNVPAVSRKDAGGLQSGKLKIDLTIADLNKPQTITEPKNAKPLSDLTSQFGLGGATGATTGAAGTTGSTPSGSSATQSGSATTGAPAANPEYLACLDKAGTDLAAVQKCATQLSQ